jgi:adenosylmethionine-8-amino-7-oxononanoate aminotransferase
MVNINQLIESDLRHIWHPCSQMKDFEQCPPIVVHEAKGSYLYTNHGALIDAISSWWCKSLGHGHPAILQAIMKQAQQFEHVIAANTTHPTMVKLAELLADITGKQHLFFASDGASAVEIAMKLVIHATQLKGLGKKKQFMALSNGYHGETLGTMSVSDLGIYKEPYQSFGLECHFIPPPYVTSSSDPVWADCGNYWDELLPRLNASKDTVCAIIVEPIVQGAGGMLCYSADFLKRLRLWAQENDIYFIADEIMTGLGRTGTWLACEHAGIEADIICLSKNLTSGSIPFSCVMIDHKLFELFYADYGLGKSFLHSHTYSGNALALAASLATIQTMQQEHVLDNIQEIQSQMLVHMNQIAERTGKLSCVRGIGGIVAAELTPVPGARIGYQLYQEALQQGALLRPIGNTLYWLPPLNIDKKTISKLAEITLNSIDAAYRALSLDA